MEDPKATAPIHKQEKKKNKFAINLGKGIVGGGGGMIILLGGALATAAMASAFTIQRRRRKEGGGGGDRTDCNRNRNSQNGSISIGTGKKEIDGEDESRGLQFLLPDSSPHVDQDQHLRNGTTKVMSAVETDPVVSISAESLNLGQKLKLEAIAEEAFSISNNEESTSSGLRIFDTGLVDDVCTSKPVNDAAAFVEPDEMEKKKKSDEDRIEAAVIDLAEQEVYQNMQVEFEDGLGNHVVNEETSKDDSLRVDIVEQDVLEDRSTDEEVMIKNKYPIRLVDELFDQLQAEVAGEGQAEEDESENLSGDERKEKSNQEIAENGEVADQVQTKDNEALEGTIEIDEAEQEPDALKTIVCGGFKTHNDDYEEMFVTESHQEEIVEIDEAVQQQGVLGMEVTGGLETPTDDDQETLATDASVSQRNSYDEAGVLPQGEHLPVERDESRKSFNEDDARVGIIDAQAFSLNGTSKTIGENLSVNEQEDQRDEDSDKAAQVDSVSNLHIESEEQQIPNSHVKQTAENVEEMSDVAKIHLRQGEDIRDANDQGTIRVDDFGQKGSDLVEENSSPRVNEDEIKEDSSSKEQKERPDQHDEEITAVGQESIETEMTEHIDSDRSHDEQRIDIKNDLEGSFEDRETMLDEISARSKNPSPGETTEGIKEDREVYSDEEIKEPLNATHDNIFIMEKGHESSPMQSSKDEVDSSESIDDTSEEDSAEKADNSSEGTGDSSADSTAEPIWPSESIHEEIVEEIITKEVGGSIKEDRGEHENGEIVSDMIQNTTAAAFMDQYLSELAMANKQTTKRTKSMAAIATFLVSLWSACFWSFGLPFLKVCLVIILVVILSKKRVF